MTLCSSCHPVIRQEYGQPVSGNDPAYCDVLGELGEHGQSQQDLHRDCVREKKVVAATISELGLK